MNFNAGALITFLFIFHRAKCTENTDMSSARTCEPIRIEICRNIGYNETSMPNLVGMELQSDVQFTLETFGPLIEFVCSTQLKLFLCATYVPMCTPKVAQPIGPCRNLCESVRSRCQPVLTGFGFPWPPALECSRFPKENNYETMCMEGPGEDHIDAQDQDLHFIAGLDSPTLPAHGTFDCPGISKTHLYVKLFRSGRCAPMCDADVLFSQHEKHLSEMWVMTWTYAALGLGAIATISLFFSDKSKIGFKWSCMLTSLVWCHFMVILGWTVRFISGREATACGYDPQLLNVSLLLIDGLSNASCAANFLLRYYFGMAACVWWAILCLGWHREIRQNNPEAWDHIKLDGTCSQLQGQQVYNFCKTKTTNITHSNIARFAAWSLPAFQTTAVIIIRLIDADELLGSCFVGNQSDSGLQIFVATPLFCYWIFGSVNLISGYLVYRRSKELLRNRNLSVIRHLRIVYKGSQSGIGTFLFIYCVPYGLLLFAVIYEYANIDIWLNVPASITAVEGMTTPMWPFLTRAFMEIVLGILCFAWVIGPKISTICKFKIISHQCNVKRNIEPTLQNRHISNIAYSTVSYQTVRQNPQNLSTAISMNQMSNCISNPSLKRYHLPSKYLYIDNTKYKKAQVYFKNHAINKCNETVL